VTLIALIVLTAMPGLASAAKASKGSPKVPHFVDETATSGVEHRYEGSFMFFTGGGVAVLDCDTDGRPDLYFAGGESPAGLFRNESAVGGELAFIRVPSDVTDLTLVTGAYPLDIDSDGLVDLAVLRRGENVLLRGLGDCTFERANETFDFDGEDDWTTAFSAKWDTGATLPTLFMGDYLTIVEYPEQPDCDGSAIYRAAPGSATYDAPEALTPGFCTLSALFSDWDRSGRRDLRLTNDKQYYIDGEDQLWRVQPGQPPVAWTRDEGWPRLQVWGMGLASDDLTGDGRPEVYVTSFADNKLQSLPDGVTGPAYENIAGDLGVGVAQPAVGGESLPSTSWHAEFDDVNNDGYLDLYVAKGNVEAMTENAMKDPSELLLGRSRGKFKRAAKAAGIVQFDKARGAALTDLNLDGLLDLVEVKRAVPARIWRNVGAGTAAKPKVMGHWLGVELAQPAPNVDAIGAWIEVEHDGRTTTREVTVGGGHAGGQLGPMHFGLGPVDEARVRVTWPDGEVGEWLVTDADQRILIERGAAAPIPLPDPET
jgi:hypothetical protein